MKRKQSEKQSIESTKNTIHSSDHLRNDREPLSRITRPTSRHCYCFVEDATIFGRDERKGKRNQKRKKEKQQQQHLPQNTFNILLFGAFNAYTPPECRISLLGCDCGATRDAAKRYKLRFASSGSLWLIMVILGHSLFDNDRELREKINDRSGGNLHAFQISLWSVPFHSTPAIIAQRCRNN